MLLQNADSSKADDYPRERLAIFQTQHAEGALAFLFSLAVCYLMCYVMNLWPRCYRFSRVFNYLVYDLL
jgi:hypothetical protein